MKPHPIRTSSPLGSRCHFWQWILAFAACFLGASWHCAASIDVVPLQQLIDAGNSPRALELLNHAVESDPDNAKLLYNQAVAAYAAKDFDTALLALDRVDSLGNKILQHRARFQRGNTEYQLGVVAQKANTDETIARWKSSLEAFEQTVSEDPKDDRARSNAELVRRQLVDLLLAAARKSFKEAQTNNLATIPARMRQIDDLRNAFEKFGEAAKTAPQNQEAREGKEASRQQLVDALIKTGEPLTQAPLQTKFNRREPSLPEVDTRPLDVGMDMLEEAKQLKPDDAQLDKTLQAARERVADARVMQAEHYMMFEERIPIAREKLALLRMAREEVDKALERVPDHQLAQAVRDEINRRLAKVHEDEGDKLNQDSDNANLEQQAMWLSQAVDHYQQAQELLNDQKDKSQDQSQQQQQANNQGQQQQPQPRQQGKQARQQQQQQRQQQLQGKEKSTQQRLAEALDKLADKLMSNPDGPAESMEAKAARLEGAEQALNELAGIQPSPHTTQRSEKVRGELDALREMMGDMGKKPGGEQPQPGDEPGGKENPQPQWAGAPVDAPPRINSPGVNQQAPRAGRSLRDY